MSRFKPGDLVRSTETGDYCVIMETNGAVVRIGGNDGRWDQDRFVLVQPSAVSVLNPIMELQVLLGIRVDGIVGPETMDAVRKVQDAIVRSRAP